MGPHLVTWGPTTQGRARGRVLVLRSTLPLPSPFVVYIWFLPPILGIQLLKPWESPADCRMGVGVPGQLPAGGWLPGQAMMNRLGL